MKRAGPFVIVFGSLHYDIMIEAPDRPRKGETVTGQAWYPKCGGKGGNQAIAAAGAGASAAMIGALGDDDFGRTLLANLNAHGVDTRFVGVRRDAGSGMSVAIFDAEGDYGAVIVSSSNLTLGEADVERAQGLVAETAVLLLQNEVPHAANVAAARAVRRSGGRTVLNAAPARQLDADLLGLVDILVVNAIEAEFLSGVPVADTLDGAADAAGVLLGLCPAAIVTAGGAGVAYADRTGARLALAALPVKVESTHGAGDAFVGSLGAALARGASIADAIDAANRAAGLLVSTPESQRL